jgi:uncharacterized protein
MLLSLRSLSGAHEHLEKQFAAALFKTTEGDLFRVASPVLLSFDVDAQEAGRYRVAGHLTGEIELACSRCLEPFTLPSRPISICGMCRAPRTSAKARREVEEDDLATAFYDDDQIDLAHLIMEQFQLALPMKPLCAARARAVPAMRHEPEYRLVRLHVRWEDPRLAALQERRRKP